MGWSLLFSGNSGGEGGEGMGGEGRADGRRLGMIEEGRLPVLLPVLRASLLIACCVWVYLARSCGWRRQARRVR